jgi:nucleoside-diphosphate-sugar epimerase
VTINPSFVLGRSLATTTASTSISALQQLGGSAMKTGAPALVMGVVDVRDVAQAHLKAGFTPAAGGRYITRAR